MNGIVYALQVFIYICTASSLIVAGIKIILSMRLKWVSSYPTKLIFDDGSLSEQLIAVKVSNWFFQQDRLLKIAFRNAESSQLGLLPISMIGKRDRKSQEKYVVVSNLKESQTCQWENLANFKLVAIFESGKVKYTNVRLLEKRWSRQN